MKKFIILLSAFMVLSLPVLAGQRELRMTTGNMLYLKRDFFSLKVISEANKEGVELNGEEFKKLIKKYPNAYKEYQAYESDAMMSVVVLLGSEIAAGGLVYLSFGTDDYGTSSVNTPMLIGALGISLVGGIVGYMMQNSAVNHFYASLHEYNKTIVYLGFRKSGCLGVGVQQNF